VDCVGLKKVGFLSSRLRLRLIKVLDQKDFVSILPIDNLIHQFLRQQDSVTAGAQSKLLADLGMTKRIVVGIGDGCVGDLVERESGSRV